MAEKKTFKWNELSNDSKWILDGTSYTGSFTKNGENYIWADTAGNRWENMEYDGEKITSSLPGQLFITQADGGMTCGSSHWSLKKPREHATLTVSGTNTNAHTTHAFIFTIPRTTPDWRDFAFLAATVTSSHLNSGSL